MDDDPSRFAGSLASSPAVAWSPPPVAPTQRSPRLPVPGVLAVGAGLVMLVSAWLPWFTVGAGGVSFSTDGMTSGLHGHIVAIVGSVVALLSFGIVVGNVDRAGWGAVALLAAVGAGVAVYEWSRIGDVSHQVNAGIPGGVGVHASVGWGLWLVVLGSVVSFGAALAACFRR